MALVHLGRLVGRGRPGHARQVGHRPRLELGLELRGVAGPGLLADGALPPLALRPGRGPRLAPPREGVADEGDAALVLGADLRQPEGVNIALLLLGHQTILAE